MKLKQLITGGALAATVLTIGTAQAEPQNPLDGVVFCKAKIYSSGESLENQISITLPFTGDRDYTYWNLGAVPAGGVADSWHSKGGPGRFEAHNNGEVGAYVYLTSAGGMNYNRYGYDNGQEVNGILKYEAEFQNTVRIKPTPSLQHWRHSEEGMYYCLAFTRDLEGKMPTWHMLDMWTNAGNLEMNNDTNCYWMPADGSLPPLCYVGAYMGYLDAGEYMPFDVKFWAPRRASGESAEQNVNFTFMVEAAPFPLWEHDADVQ